MASALYSAFRNPDANPFTLKTTKEQSLWHSVVSYNKGTLSIIRWGMFGEYSSKLIGLISKQFEQTATYAAAWSARAKEIHPMWCNPLAKMIRLPVVIDGAYESVKDAWSEENRFSFTGFVRMEEAIRDLTEVGDVGGGLFAGAAKLSGEALLRCNPASRVAAKACRVAALVLKQVGNIATLCGFVNTATSLDLYVAQHNVDSWDNKEFPNAIPAQRMKITKMNIAKETLNLVGDVASVVEIFAPATIPGVAPVAIAFTTAKLASTILGLGIGYYQGWTNKPPGGDGSGSAAPTTVGIL